MEGIGYFENLFICVAVVNIVVYFKNIFNLKNYFRVKIEAIYNKMFNITALWCFEHGVNFLRIIFKCKKKYQ